MLLKQRYLKGAHVIFWEDGKDVWGKRMFLIVKAGRREEVGLCRFWDLGWSFRSSNTPNMVSITGHHQLQITFPSAGFSQAPGEATGPHIPRPGLWAEPGVLSTSPPLLLCFVFTRVSDHRVDAGVSNVRSQTQMMK